MNEDVSEQALWCMTQDKKWGDDSVQQRDTVTRLLTFHVSRSHMLKSALFSDSLYMCLATLCVRDSLYYTCVCDSLYT